MIIFMAEQYDDFIVTIISTIWLNPGRWNINHRQRNMIYEYTIYIPLSVY